MIGLEEGTSGFGIDCFINGATTTAPENVTQIGEIVYVDCAVLAY